MRGGGGEAEAANDAQLAALEAAAVVDRTSADGSQTDRPSVRRGGGEARALRSWRQRPWRRRWTRRERRRWRGGRGRGRELSAEVEAAPAAAAALAAASAETEATAKAKVDVEQALDGARTQAETRAADEEAAQEVIATSRRRPPRRSWLRT